VNAIKNRSILSLIARGVSSELAQRLFSEGHKIGTLKTKSLDELLSLGLSEPIARGLRSGRTPIPEDRLLKLLYDNKWVCCVCRSRDDAVIVHHIEPWETSRSHDANNLVVLCPNDHSKAHSRGDLTQNLTPTRLRKLKRLWEAEVGIDDSIVIQKAAQSIGEYWYFFNLLRLYEFAEHEQIDLQTLAHYPDARIAGILDAHGHLVPEERDSLYAYSGSHSPLRYYYAKDLFMHVLGKLSVTNISDRLDKGDLSNTIIRNDLIYVEGAHNFKQLNTVSFGPGQLVRGRRSANSVCIEFVFDRWQATSTSANTVWLTGRNVVGSFCRVGDISRSEDKKTIVIKCTVLAICAELPGMRARSYISNTVFAYMHSVYDEDDQESDDWNVTFDKSDTL
jgi:hypothetical protein